MTGGAATVKLNASSAAMASGGSTTSWSVTAAPVTATLQVSPVARSTAGSSVKAVGPPETVAAWAPLVAQVRVRAPAARSTGSVNVTVGLTSAATPVAPSAGVVDWTAGAVSVPAVTAMSSMPTHSSEPTASVVRMRTWRFGWSFAAGGRATLTGVTGWSEPAPAVASATKPAGTFVKLPLVPARYWTATGCTALSVASMSRSV